MSLYRRKGSKYWYFSFEFKGRTYQGTTDQTNKNIAKLVESKKRSDAALEHHGIAPPKDVPMFKAFLEGKFMDYVRDHAKKPGTVRAYGEHVARLLKFKPFAELRLSQVDEEVISGYRPKVSIATLNGDLRTLRRALSLACEWRLHRKVKVHMFPGEEGREFVLTGEMEKAYLELAAYPLREVAILMLDCGLRPEECCRLRKSDISLDDLRVGVGKTANSARILPLTERAKRAIEFLCALFPDSPWLFPGRKTHLHPRSVTNMHCKLRRENGLPEAFVLYSLRHTYGTRLAESGASPFEIKSLMGHYSITVSQKYIHLSSDHLRLAAKRKEMMDKAIRGEVHAPHIPESQPKSNSS